MTTVVYNAVGRKKENSEKGTHAFGEGRRKGDNGIGEPRDELKVKTKVDTENRGSVFTGID